MDVGWVNPWVRLNWVGLRPKSHRLDWVGLGWIEVG